MYSEMERRGSELGKRWTLLKFKNIKQQKREASIREKNNPKDWHKEIFWILIALGVFVIAKAIGYSNITNQYDKGIIDGYNIALDTVKTILDNQVKSDTSITKLVVVNPDTNVYYLSRRTLKQKP